MVVFFVHGWAAQAISVGMGAIAGIGARSMPVVVLDEWEFEEGEEW